MLPMIVVSAYLRILVLGFQIIGNFAFPLRTIHHRWFLWFRHGLTQLLPIKAEYKIDQYLLFIS